MGKPLLLDLFCGAGGAAMGYHRAGFDILGVDIAPQPRYPFAFVQADALGFLAWLIASGDIRQFAAIHASPPCGDFCALREFTTPGKHPRLIEPVYQLAMSSGVPFVIENSDRAPMPGSVVLCGSMFDLPIRRHRGFWSNMLLFKPRSCQHTGHELTFSRCRDSQYRDAMGVPWMRAREDARQAIPPAYTEWIGRQLMAVVDNERVA